MVQLVFATSGEARAFGLSLKSPQIPRAEPARASINLDSSQARAFVIFDPLKSFISNLATGRAEGNGTERGQVKRGAGESGSGQVSQYES